MYIIKKESNVYFINNTEGNSREIYSQCSVQDDSSTLCYQRDSSLEGTAWFFLFMLLAVTYIAGYIIGKFSI